jgi:hypothetical protein
MELAENWYTDQYVLEKIMYALYGAITLAGKNATMMPKKGQKTGFYDLTQ